MEIRKLTISDYDALYDLWIHTPGMGLYSIDDSRQGIAKYLAKNPDTCFGAVENGKLIGAILAGNDGRRGYFSHTAVAAESQRKGIGTKLVEAVLASFRKLGITKVALLAFSRNEKGNAFWEKMGFHERTDLVYRDFTIAEMTHLDT